MYPILLNLEEKRVLIVGGGRVARRKLEPLLAAGAKVTIIAPDLDPQIDASRLVWIQRPYQKGDLAGYSLIFACTDQDHVNRAVYEEAGPGQWVNNTSDKDHSDFYNLKTIEGQGDLLLALSSKGQSVKLTKLVAEAFQDWLDQHFESLKERADQE